MDITIRTKNRLVGATAALCLIGALLGLFYIYKAGVTGGFLLDDFANLSTLARVGGELSWEGIRQYLNAGVAGPAGRPISLLSFLLDAQDWPADATRFKLTNVFIHILNGILLFWASLLLLQRIPRSAQRAHLWAALLTLFWLFSPYHVSAVLYAIQRMTLLSCFFVLSGIVFYLKGRTALEANEGTWKGILLIVLAYFFGLGLGTLSKENAVVFVLLIPLIEWVFYDKSRAAIDPLSRRFLLTIIFIPPFALVIALVAQWPGLNSEYLWHRDFTLGERLLTQARVLGYYLTSYILPQREYIGLYGDAFPISKGLLSPPSTLAWFAIHGLLIVMAVRMRAKAPLVTFGVLFFYIAHALESTFVPLMMFFEHRNYLPATFLILPLAALPLSRNVFVSLLVIILISGAFLHLRVIEWSDALTFRERQLEKHPDSTFAALGLASWHLRNEAAPESVEILREFSKRYPPNMRVGITLIKGACRIRDVQPSDIEVFKQSPYAARGKVDDLWDFGLVAAFVKAETCSPLSFDDLRSFLENYKNAFPRNAEREQIYHRANSILEAFAGNTSALMHSGFAAIRAYPNAKVTLEFCGTLIRYQRYQAACTCLEEGAYAFQEETGGIKTIVRTLLGFEDHTRNEYEVMLGKACAAGHVQAAATID